MPAPQIAAVFVSAGIARMLERTRNRARRRIRLYSAVITAATMLRVPARLADKLAERHMRNLWIARVAESFAPRIAAITAAALEEQPAGAVAAAAVAGRHFAAHEPPPGELAH